MCAYDVKSCYIRTYGGSVAPVIQFNPSPGDVLLCDFEIGGERAGAELRTFRHPEIGKQRLVVVVSRHARKRPSAVIVVPFSSSLPPHLAGPSAYRIPVEKYRFFRKPVVYAKAEAITHVALERLARIPVDDKMVVPRLDHTDLAGVQRAVLHALNLGGLADYLSVSP